MTYIWTNTETTKEFTVDRVVDGDTLDVTLKLPFEILCKKRVRFARVDAPELRGGNEESKKKALETSLYVKKRIDEAKGLKLVSYKAGKYGRYLVDIFCDGVNLNKELVDKGLAKAYKQGGRNVKGTRNKTNS